MPEGMTKIQYRSETTFAFIKGNNLCLAGAGPEDSL